MNAFENETALKNELAALDQRIDQLNDKKIISFIEALGLHQRSDVPKNYLGWETILIVIPDKKISHTLRQYKYAISRIAFITNVNAKQIHLYDFSEWKTITKNKTQLQIRSLLKENFGGIPKNANNNNKTN
jgi:hypothetical protein